MMFLCGFSILQHPKPINQIGYRFRVPLKNTGLSFRASQCHAGVHYFGRRILHPQSYTIKKLLTTRVSRQYSRAGRPSKNSNGNFAARAKRISQKA